MENKQHALVVILLLLGLSTGFSFAEPVKLYQIDFAPQTDIYRLAGLNQWPVYHISGNTALLGREIKFFEEASIIKSTLIYQGSSENLRWVFWGRKSMVPCLPVKTVYSANGVLLTEASVLSAAGIKSGGDYIIKGFDPQPIVISAANIVINSELARDTMVATLCHLVDTAQVRARIESLQSFGTRYFDAANHDSVSGWIRNQFLSMGITDVKPDTFDIGYGPQHNIIATIPGLLDTSVVYIVGGHYDSYSRYPYILAPGADDNASGTVAAMEMARIISQAGNRPNFTVRFIAFDVEEWGLYGSEHYTQKAVVSGMNIGCMLNYDMIGYRGNDSVFVSKLYPGSEDYAYLLGQMAEWYGRTADTNLMAAYNSDYLQGSDSWEFYIRGFPVTYSEEYNFSTVYHQINDSTTYMNMRYCTSIVKAGVGLLATMANYPQKVIGLAVTDMGKGSQLFIHWQPNRAPNIINYKIGWGKTSGTYDNFITVSDTAYIINGLMEDSLYYIGVVVIDDQDRESPFIAENKGTPSNNRERISDIKLYQNIPNPFDKQTTISYQLPKAGWVRLDIYNIAGQLVKTLANLVQPAGSYAVKWDGRDNKNRQVSAGVYIYHLTAGDKTQSRKMVVIK